METWLGYLFNWKSALVSFSSYTIVSLVLYYYPNIIHKNKNNNKKHNFVVVSHRGGSGENKENTLAAFKHSYEIGTDVFELDVHITKDGQVVVAHDNNLSRLCGVNKLITDLNFNELPDLLEEHEEDIFLKKTNEIKRVVTSSLITNNLHHRNSPDHTSSSRKIPLLEDVFKSFPNTLINLDVKINNDDLIKQVNDLIIKYNREKITIWGSFRDEVTKKLIKLNPNIEIYFSSKGCIKLMIFILFGLLPFVKFKETYFEILMPNYLIQRNRDSLPKAAIPIFLLVKWIFIRKSLVKHLQKRGISVYYWVLNTDEEFEHAIELGVNGIITDFPSRLIHFIQNNENYKKCLLRPEKNSD